MASSSAAPKSLPLKETLEGLPELSSTSSELRSRTRDVIQSSSNIPILVALDDDPTGTQTCHDIHVLTTWTVPVLKAEFETTAPGSGFFILTNSRALHPPAARELTIEICQNLKEAAAQAGKRFEVVLRGDSTLRGHFPVEPQAVEEALGASDAWILAPFFLQGGRYTIDDVHYVAEGDVLVPAAETPFAKDATFGFKSSHMADWVVEKSKGAISRDLVRGISLKDIRTGGPDKVTSILQSVSKGTVLVANAASEEDMDVLVQGILQASSQGKKFLFRSAAAFVSARLGISPIPPITAQELKLSTATGGLIIAGSYVPKTTAQLRALIDAAADKLTTVELDVNALLASDASRAQALQHALATASQALQQPRDVLIMTSRAIVTGADARSSLDIGSVVAAALVTFLTQLDVRPRYLIAKGGITSSDMATKGLRMKRATIVGQAAPGVPLWRCDEPETVTDALHRAILGLDSNDRALFASACLTTPEMEWHGGGISLHGWTAISALFERVFSLITTHVVSNIRVTFVDEAAARLTAHAVSYHVRPEDRESVEERSFTGWSLYDVELVRDEGVWRIKTWRADVLRTVGDRTIVHG